MAISVPPETAEVPLRLRPRRVLPRGCIAQALLRRPAASALVPKEENEEMGGEVRAEWIWAKKWAEQYHDQGGVWTLMSLRRESGTVHERWQWKED